MRFEASDRSERRGPSLWRRGRGALSRWVRPTLDVRAGMGFLTGDQLATLRALAEVVAVGGPIAEDDWGPVRDALVTAARERPGFRALCARGCRVIAGLRPGFATTTLEERTACVVAHRLGVRPVPAAELLLVGRRGQHELRELLVPELVRAYFDAPVGWALVGYGAALGECRDPFAYTTRPA